MSTKITSYKDHDIDRCQHVPATSKELLSCVSLVYVLGWLGRDKEEIYLILFKPIYLIPHLYFRKVKNVWGIVLLKCFSGVRNPDLPLMSLVHGSLRRAEDSKKITCCTST